MTHLLKRLSIVWGMMGLVFVVPGICVEQSDSLLTDPVGVSSPTVQAYVFKGDRFRDPFIPLVGASVGYEGPRASAEPLSPFNPSNAEVKGIVKTTTGRWAVLRTSEGATYLVQNGKIFDPKRKVVEGYQCVVKEKSLLILGPGKQESELTLKKESETAP